LVIFKKDIVYLTDGINTDTDVVTPLDYKENNFSITSAQKIFYV